MQRLLLSASSGFKGTRSVQTFASVQRLHDRETLVDLDSERKDIEQRLEAGVDPQLVFAVLSHQKLLVGHSGIFHYFDDDRDGEFDDR